MAHDTTGTGHDVDTGTDSWLSWALVIGVLCALVGVPALVLAHVEFGLLAALGLPPRRTLGVVAMVPGFALGALSLLAMLAPD